MKKMKGCVAWGLWEQYEKKARGVVNLGIGTTPPLLIWVISTHWSDSSLLEFGTRFEGVSTCLPMITWPPFTEQFNNEKLVTKVLKARAAVGWLKNLLMNLKCMLSNYYWRSVEYPAYFCGPILTFLRIFLEALSFMRTGCICIVLLSFIKLKYDSFCFKFGSSSYFFFFIVPFRLPAISKNRKTA